MDTPISFQDFREEWLADVREGNPSTTELGHRFARKLLTQWLEIDDSSDDLVYCDGAGDGGIDIAYLNRGETDGEADGDTWYLVQSKYGSAFQGVRTLLEEGQKVIDTLDGQRARLNSLAEGLLERLSTFRRRASDRDHIVLVFASEDPLNDAQKRVLNDVRAMGRARLGAFFDVEQVSIEMIYLRTLEEGGDSIGQRTRVPVRTDMARSGENLLVGSISLLNMYDFLKAYRQETGDLDQLYEKNVRRFLGSRGKVNKAMHQTLQQHPEQFGLFNNGITIVVTDFDTASDGTTTLVEPYVVNGCQTTRTIWEVCHRRLEAGGTGNDPELDAWQRKAEQGVVVAKIVKVGTAGELLLEDITRYTNTQNAVREKDFLALTSDFKTWARQMEDRYNMFLEIQRGAWDSRRAFQRQHPSERQFSEYANAFDLLKVYGAGWLGEAGTAFGKNGPFAPNGSIFKRILNGATGADAFGVDDLYAAYRLDQAANGYKFGRGAIKQQRRQTRFLFFMVVIDLLKDVLIRSGVDASNKDITAALVTLMQSGNELALSALLDTAVEVIDEYLTAGSEDSVFDEPAYRNGYNNDLNSFLKFEQLGKSDDSTPRLRSLIAGIKRTMGRGGATSPRELVTAAITV